MGSSAETTPLADDLNDVVGYLLNRLAERSRLATARRLTDLNVRPRQVGILFVLRSAGALSQQAIGERLAMDRTTTMQLVSALEKLSAIERADHPCDRRAYVVRLTAAGRRLLQTVERRLERIDREVLAGLTDREADALATLLRKALSAPFDEGGQSESCS